MKRRLIAALMLAGVMSGCLNIDGQPETGGMKPHFGRGGPPTVPGVMGPHGEGVPMASPYNMAPPGSEYAARMMMSRSVPMNMVQMNPGGMPMPGPGGMNMPSPMMPPGGILSPPGVPGMPGAPAGGGLQKTSFMAMGPDSGVVNANMPPFKSPGNVMQAQFANSSPVGSLFPAQRTQVFFPKPAGMKIYWFTQGHDGKPNYSTTPLETPGRYNFAQGAIYRLKLTHIPGRPALELYPTLEVVPTSPRTNEFLAHNSVPVEFSEDDFKQVVDRNYIVKVIYLPDPQFQDAAGAGPEELVSTRLEPGQDPIQEALRRGSILLVVRIGNIDQGLQHSPGTMAPIPGGPPALMKPPGMGVPPLMQVPFPTHPVVPGMPNPMPPLPGVVVPPPGVVFPPAVPEKKGENIPLPKKEEKKIDGGSIVPPLNLPVPPNLNLPLPPGGNPADAIGPGGPALPAPPAIPNLEKDVKPGAPPLPTVPVVPTGSSKEVDHKSNVSPAGPSVVLPTLPTMDTPARPDLPFIPTIPANKQ